jgi:hypothetical protein
MAYGFFTIEQWKRPKPGAKSQWVPIEHLDAHHTLSDALRSIEEGDRAGFYRVVQTQRWVWAEKVDRKVRFRRKHASNAAELARTAATFERDGGRWPTKAR